MRHVSLALLLAAGLARAGEPADAPPTTTAAAAPAAPSLEQLYARADLAFHVRDQAGKMEEVDNVLAEAARLAPDDYGLLWRESRQYFWRSDDPKLPKDLKSQLGKAGWEKGDHAAAKRPDRVEGWFYAAAGVGNYALGIGIFTALTQGIEGKYKERLAKAEAIDPGYDAGGIATAWGRFWYELPWPKYDARKCEQRLRQALSQNRMNVRAKVYLADLLRKEDRPKAARALLEEAAAQEPGAYDAPEERRWQAEARSLLDDQNP
jgi:hypothetical protein